MRKVARNFTLALSITVVDIFCSALGVAVAWYMIVMQNTATEEGFAGETTVVEFQVLDVEPNRRDATLLGVAYWSERTRQLVRPENAPATIGPIFCAFSERRNGASNIKVILNGGPFDPKDRLVVFLYDWHFTEPHEVRVRVSIQGPRQTSGPSEVKLSESIPSSVMPLQGITTMGVSEPFTPRWEPITDE